MFFQAIERSNILKIIALLNQMLELIFTIIKTKLMRIAFLAKI